MLPCETQVSVYHYGGLIYLGIYFVASFSIDLHFEVYLRAAGMVKHSLQHLRSLFSLELFEDGKVAVRVFQFVCAKEVLNHRNLTIFYS